MQRLWHEVLFALPSSCLFSNPHLLQCLPTIAWAEVIHEDWAPPTRYMGDFLPIRRRPELWHVATHSLALMHFAGIETSRKLCHTLLAVQNDAVCLLIACQALGPAPESIATLGLALHAGSSSKAVKCHLQQKGPPGRDSLAEQSQAAPLSRRSLCRPA